MEAFHSIHVSTGTTIYPQQPKLKEVVLKPESALYQLLQHFARIKVWGIDLDEQRYVAERRVGFQKNTPIEQLFPLLRTLKNDMNLGWCWSVELYVYLNDNMPKYKFEFAH